MAIEHLKKSKPETERAGRPAISSAALRCSTDQRTWNSS
jgi:hypothetical protein